MDKCIAQAKESTAEVERAEQRQAAAALQEQQAAAARREREAAHASPAGATLIRREWCWLRCIAMAVEGQGGLCSCQLPPATGGSVGGGEPLRSAGASRLTMPPAAPCLLPAGGKVHPAD